MGCDDSTGQRRLRVETVRGEPYHVGGRKLTPVARVVSYGRARGTVGTKGISGIGGGFAWITPLSIVEETANGEHRIAITDTTATALKGMLAGSVIIILFFTAIRWLVRRDRKARAAEE